MNYKSVVCVSGRLTERKKELMIFFLHSIFHLMHMIVVMFSTTMKQSPFLYWIFYQWPHISCSIHFQYLVQMGKWFVFLFLFVIFILRWVCLSCALFDFGKHQHSTWKKCILFSFARVNEQTNIDSTLAFM